MAISFYFHMLKKSATDPNFRRHLQSEVWDMVKHQLPGRLVTPREDYVYCRESNPNVPGGKWLPPQSLAWRPAAYGLLYNDRDEVLMVWDTNLDEHWYFPGGGMNRGETKQEAIRREFQEETGLEVEVGPVVEVMDDFFIMPTGRAVHGLANFFLVKAVGGALNLKGNGFDTSEVRFFTNHPNLETSETGLHPLELFSQAVIEKGRILRQSLNFDCGFRQADLAR